MEVGYLVYLGTEGVVHYDQKGGGGGGGVASLPGD